MKNQFYIAGLLTISVATFYVTKTYFPRIETKQVEVEKEIVRTDIKTIVRTIEKPDGTKETIKEKIDKSVKQEISTKESIVVKKDFWKVDVAARVKGKDLIEPLYDLHVSRRLLETPFFVGVKISTDKSLGLSLGIEF